MKSEDKSIEYRNLIKVNIVNIFLLPILIFYPLLSIPIVILDNLHRKKVDYRLIVLLGILAYIYIPTTFDDLGRIYNAYEKSNIIFFEDIFKGKDYFLRIVFYFKNTIFMKKELLPLTATVIFYGSTFYIFNKNIKEKNIIIYTFLFLLVFLNLNPRIIITKVRMPISLGLILVGIINSIYRGKKMKGIWCYLLSAMVHYSSVLYTLFCTFILNEKMNKKMVKFFKFSLVFYFLTPNILFNLINFFPIPDQYKRSVYTYTLGRYGANYEKGLNALIYDYIYNILGYFNVLYLVFFKGDSKLRNISKNLWILGNLFNCIPNLFFRFSFLPRILTVLVMADEYSEAKIENKIYMIFYFLISLGLFLLTLYMMRESVYSSWILNIHHSLSRLLSLSVDTNNLIVK